MQTQEKTAAATYEVEIKKVFIKKPLVNQGDKPQSQMIVHRMMYVTDPKAFLDSGEYRVTLRKGFYTISAIPRVKQPYWDNPSGKPEAWYTLAEDVIQPDGTVKRPWKKMEGPLNEQQFKRWLSYKLGENQAAIAIAKLSE